MPTARTILLIKILRRGPAPRARPPRIGARRTISSLAATHDDTDASVFRQGVNVARRGVHQRVPVSHPERPRGRGERAGPVRTGAGITGKVEGAANSTGEPQPRRTPRPPHPPGQGQDQPAPPRPNPQALRPTSARASGSRGAGPPESHGHPQPRRRRTYAGTLTRSTPDPLGPRRRRATRRRG